MNEHFWIIGFACGAGIVNPNVGWAVMLVVTFIWQVWK